MSAAEGLGEVAAVIAAHGYDTGWRCSCGWTGTSDEYDTHLAEALAPLIAERERRAAEAAWSHGLLAGVQSGEFYTLPRNPYRADPAEETTCSE